MKTIFLLLITTPGRRTEDVRECIQTFPDCVDNEIYAYNKKHQFRSNTKDCGGKKSLDWLTK